MTVFASSETLTKINKQFPNSPLVILPVTFLERNLKMAMDPADQRLPIFCYYTHYNFRTQKVQLFKAEEKAVKEDPVTYALGYAFPVHQEPTFIESLERTLDWFAVNISGVHTDIIQKKVADRNFIGFYFRPLKRILIHFLIPSTVDMEVERELSFEECIRGMEARKTLFDPFSMCFLQFIEQQKLF